MPSFNLSPKVRMAIATVVGITLICAAVYLHYHPLDDNYSGFTYYRGSTSSREYIDITPDPSQTITMVGESAILGDERLGENIFNFSLKDGYFYLIPYDYSEIIIDVYEGSAGSKMGALSGIYKIRSSQLHEKCQYNIKCSWPGLYVFYDNGDKEFLSIQSKQYLVITTKQR